MRFLLLYSPRWLFLIPGLLLMAGGFITGGWLMKGPIFIGNVGFDVQTLLYAAMAIIIGFQAIIFAVFTKAFAISEGLLPEDKRLNKVSSRINLEVGLVVGALLIFMGLGGSVYAVRFWE